MRYTRLILPLFYGLPFLLHAQQNNFISFTAKDGLPVSSIFSLEQDSRNFLWIGTDGGGLSRFDGNNFETFTTKNGLAGNAVRSILEDSQGRLWIGTENGISIYDGHSFMTLDQQLAVYSSSVIDLYEDSEGWIWAATDREGLRKIRFPEKDSIQVIPLTTDHGLAADFVFEILEDDRGRMWFATNGGVDVLIPRNDTFTLYHFGSRASLRGMQATSLLLDSKGYLWAGTRYSGLIRLPAGDDLDAAKEEIFNTSSGLSHNQVWDILEDASGNIWIATDEGGVNLFSGDGFKAYTQDQGLPSNQAYRLLEDSELNIWIGSYGGGLSKFSGRSFTVYDVNQKPGPSNVTSIIEQPLHTFWVGTYGDGLIRMQFGDGTPSYNSFSRETGLLENDISALVLDQDGTIWFSYATSGIGRLTAEGFEHFGTEEGTLISNSVNALFVDSRNRLWCATNGGITILREGSPSLFLDESNVLSSNKIQTIIEDGRGAVWIGSMNGLMRVPVEEDFATGDPDLVWYGEASGLSELNINALAADRQGDIWIGTFGGGIFRFRGAVPDTLPIIQVVAGDPLSSGNIFSLMFQNDSMLLAGTEKGLDRIVLDEGRKVKRVKRYNQAHGFTGIENNPNAIYRDPSGRFWIGTTDGLTRYDPGEERVNLQPPVPHITGIRIRHEETDWNSVTDRVVPWFNLPAALNLNWKQNHITLFYNSVSLSSPGNIRFKYRLLGLEEEWSPPTLNQEVIYQSLDPGHYDFQVIAENQEGIWSQIPASYRFIISPPIWQKWWFYTIALLCIAVMVLILIRTRERRLIRKNRLLESKVRERTREIREQKEEIESQRDEIEAQRDEIKKQRDLLLNQKQAITDSIHYAERLQRAILPHGENLQLCMPAHFIIYKPRDIVSGDFYWVKEMKNYLIFVVADCTGHGVPGAFMSMLGITLLNEQVAKSRFDKPADILERLRRKVKDTMAQEGKLEEQKDGMDMAIALYNRDTMELQFAGAYNPLYVIRKKTGSKEDPLNKYKAMAEGGRILYEVKGDRQPIGIYSMEKAFTTHSLDLREEDTLYIFSDGFLDQFGGPHRKKFKAVNFKKLLLSLQDLPMDQQKLQIEEAYEKWKGHNEQIDDICIVGLRI